MLYKIMLKQKLKHNICVNLTRIPVFVLVLVLISSIVIAPLARADQIDDQIRAITQDTSAKRAQRDQMGTEANSLSDKISKLQVEISTLQAQITGYQNKISDLENQITVKEQELAYQKKVLGENIKAMYLEGDISTLEMLASSKDLSDFVDKQQYRNSVQNKIKTTMDKIVELKHQLKAQKEENENALKDKQAVQAQLDGQQAENNQLLSLNESQQAALNQQIKQNNINVASLRAQQLAANRTYLGGTIISGDPGHGGYPAYLDQAPQDSLIDPWGMYNRECVSYTAWKVYQTYGYMPYWGGHGNANQWPASAQADGIAIGTTPRANSVAISMKGYYGHALWVEAVSGNTIYVSQYNYDFTGRYSEMSINGSGLIYIYFN